MRSEINKILIRINVWRVRNISEQNFVIFLSLIVGVVSGIAAVILKNAIHFSIKFLETNFLSESLFYYLLFPILGIALTYLFIKYIVKDNISHGVTRVLYSISKQNSILKKHNTWTSIVASTITIAFGGSVGA